MSIDFLELEFSPLAENIIKIFGSVICGIVLGLERKSHNHVIGMRTLILICLSSTLLSILSIRMANGKITGDPTRIAAGVISGIGFLGGGAIMKQGMNIKGLTSAAIIWTAASLGLALGGGLYIQVGIVLLISVTILLWLEKVETKFFPAGRSKTLHLCFESDTIDLKALKAAIQSEGLIVSDMNMSRVISVNHIILHYSIKCPKEVNFSLLIEKVKALGKLSEFSITD